MKTIEAWGRREINAKVKKCFWVGGSDRLAVISAGGIACEACYE